MFEELKPSVQDLISITVDFIENELPIVCYFTTSYWWILTTSRLVINEDQKLSYYSLSKLKNITPYDPFMDERRKKEFQTLEINFKDEVLRLKVEQGTWHGIFNMLNFFRT